MRWERLFDDLEAGLAAEAARELDSEVADRTRRERALLGLHERLAAQPPDVAVTVRVAGVGQVQALVSDVGADWVLLARQVERRLLVPFHAVRQLSGLAGRVSPQSAVAKAFGIAAALRAVSRDRAPVTVCDVDGMTITGTIDGVGQDCLEVAEHPLDLPRRPQHVIDVRVVPFHALAAVQRE
ncbi:MAG: hypothetical protein ACOYBY_02315 [Dermatophilaceae bacterium]